MARGALVGRFVARWRNLTSASRVRILLLTLAGVAVALRDVLLLGTTALLLAVVEFARVARREPARTP